MPPCSEPSAIMGNGAPRNQPCAARRLAERINILERAIGQRNMLMATVGHDLRQPLHIILRAIENLDSRRADRAGTRWAEEAMRQIDLIVDGLSRLAAASLEKEDFVERAEIRPFAVSALLDEVESRWALLAKEKGLSLRFIRGSALVASDLKMAGTILGNLVGNAIKYTDRGRILVGCRQRAEGVRIEVIDTGPGIDPAHQAMMFELGWRGSHGEEGMGLGLSLVAALCNRLGHRLDVRSVPGRGSCFAITLPCIR